MYDFVLLTLVGPILRCFPFWDQISWMTHGLRTLQGIARTGDE